MQAYELSRLISEREAGSKPYMEFLKVPDLSMGLYVLPAGSRDLQSPHAEDEVYYVVSGRARIIVADENRDVQAGSIISRSRKILEKPENKGAGVRPHPCFRGSFGHWFAFREVLIIYIPKNVAHHFHSIVQDLTVLVFFAPAEYSSRV